MDCGFCCILTLRTGQNFMAFPLFSLYAVTGTFSESEASNVANE
jgi:hypothetical protein